TRAKIRLHKIQPNDATRLPSRAWSMAGRLVGTRRKVKKKEPYIAVSTTPYWIKISGNVHISESRWNCLRILWITGYMTEVMAMASKSTIQIKSSTTDLIPWLQFHPWGRRGSSKIKRSVRTICVIRLYD